jgi:hypothetical protein
MKLHLPWPARRPPAGRVRFLSRGVSVALGAALLVLWGYQAIASAADAPVDVPVATTALARTAALQLTAVVPGPGGQRATATPTPVPRPGPGVAPAPAPSLPVDISQLVDVPAADQLLRTAVTAALQGAARRAGVAIDTSGLVYGSRDDVLVASAAVAGVDNLTPADLQAGANLMFVYLRLPTAENRLPAGFYTVHVRTVPGSNTATAQLRNEAGATVAELPARTGPLVDDASARKIKLTLEIGPKSITIDIEIPLNAAVMVDFALSE